MKGRYIDLFPGPFLTGRQYIEARTDRHQSLPGQTFSPGGLTGVVTDGIAHAEKQVEVAQSHVRIGG